MSKNYKRKIQKDEQNEEVEIQNKKELYDLEKARKQEEKEKQLKKKKNKKKKSKKKIKKTYQTSLGGRIFAVIMLILMLGSVVASVGSYLIK